MVACLTFNANDIFNEFFLRIGTLGCEIIGHFLCAGVGLGQVSQAEGSKA